ncbi:TonB-dependent receptor domain-containing protein [Horticoccus sp. 23ND18S-11]|uniref:TonB-dependent receptor domain-containing protein n=1 Tax=Horticoccus sp. 23ND18S-11 TaxID=3391832 RepID=UPI0039C8F351
MNSTRRLLELVSTVARRLVPTAIALVAFVGAPRALAQATGSISGRVQNEATGQYLNNARITVKGTDLTAFTDETGTFRLAGVPSGTATLEAFYSGLDPLQTTVTVSAGQTIERELNLTNRALYGDKSGVVKLDPFVASMSKLTEGEALATNEQRFAANIKNVVATDAFGDVIEGNVAEFMRFLPGITVDYSDVMPLGVSVRGFDPNMTNITSDGASLANASRNAASRQFDFMQVSINNISRIEVTKVPTPANPASGISGSVNMVSKSAFERSRAQLNYRVFISASSDGMMLSKQPFPYDTWERRINPGFDLDYTLPITKNFGIVFTALQSKAWNEQNISQMTWNTNAAGTGATPAKPYLQTHNIIDAPKWYERNSTGLKADWRVTPNSVLTVGLQATYYIDTNGNVNRATSVGTVATPTTTPGAALTFGDTFAHSGTGRGTASFASNLLHIDARTLGSNVRYRYQNSDWVVDVSGYASTSKTWMRHVSKGHFNTIGTALLNPAGVRVDFDDIRPEGPRSIRAFDANNREIDLLDLRNFRLNTATDGVIRNHRDDTAGTEGSVKRSMKLFEVPTSVQVGGLFKSQDRSHRRKSRVFTYNPANPADPTLAPFAMQVYKGRQNYFDYDYIPFPSPNRMAEAWGKNPALFTQTAAQQVAEEQSRIVGSENFKEITTALYLQGEARFFSNKLQVLTGVRFEKIHDKAAGPLFEPGNAFVRNSNGTFARNAAGQRIRRPEAGAAGSMEELRLTRLEFGRTYNGGFDGYYPSLHLTYNVTSNFLVRAAYAKTYGKPDYINVIPNTTISESDVSENADPSVVRGTITVSNPELKPWKADNFDLSAEYYTDSGGVFSVGAYRKNISNFHDDIVKLATADDLELLDLDPRYAGWELRTTVNGGDARVDGVEFNVRQSLAPLGGWGKYFAVFANATKLKLQGSRNAAFTRFIPESGSWGVTITRKPVTFMLKWNARGEQRQAASPAQGPDAYLYQEKRTTMDANVTYQFTRQLQLFANGRNIGNVHYNLLRYGSQTPGYAKISSTNSYGVQWAFGLKGTF